MTRKIVFRNHQSPGDIIAMTRAVADLKRAHEDWQIDVRTSCPEVWEHCPFLTPLDPKDKEVEYYDIGYGMPADKNNGVATGIHKSGWYGQHFTDAWHEDIELVIGETYPKTSYKPELWIGAIEKTWYNQVHCEFLWDGPFWILNAGRKQDNELKQYHRWPEVAKLFNAAFGGKVKLVQVGHKDHVHPELGHRVLNLVGKTDLRQLIRLTYWAQGTIGPLSLQFMLAAALEKPHVVVAGGKEGVPWQLYPNGRYLYTNGALPCCTWDGCWLGGAKGQCQNLVLDCGHHVPKCFTLIKPHDIVNAVKMYYEGGVLRA